MKNILKNKKKIIIAIVIILIIIMSITCYFIINKKEQNTDLKTEYTAYIKINPLVKLVFTCEDNCMVSDITLLNDDAKSLYKDEDYKEKTLEEVINSLISIAKENNKDVTNGDITTNYQDIEKSLNNSFTKFNINYESNIIEEKVIATYEEEYTITFDSDGGSSIESVKIKKNQTITKPSNPTKEGYTFIEWQLDGKTYDFSSKVTKNIVLKAKWQKNADTQLVDDKSNTSLNNSSVSNSQSKEETLSQKEKDNITLKQQLATKGLTWDFNSEDLAYNELDKWSGGYGGEVIKNSYGESDVAYSLKITLNTAACGGSEILNIDWHNQKPVDFIYYLHSKGYNCAGNEGYYNNKHFTINKNNELIYD